jgi:YD repeat-containing protein
VKVPLDVAAGDTAVTVFEPWDERGLAVGLTGQGAVDTALGYTKIFGPRLNVADDAQFWVDRWGAPTKLVDAIGATTTMVRGDAAMPALVTRVVAADGRVTTLSYDARGNLVQQRDSTSHLTDGQPTAVTSWAYTSLNTKDAPTSVTDPEGVVTQYPTATSPTLNSSQPERCSVSSAR